MIGVRGDHTLTLRYTYTVTLRFSGAKKSEFSVCVRYPSTIYRYASPLVRPVCLT